MLKVEDLPCVQEQLSRAGAPAEESGSSPAPVRPLQAFNVADLPELATDAARDPSPAPDVEYARAPAAAGPQLAGARPPATQGNTR